MRNVVYTTTKQDVWASDLNDLMASLRLFWMPYTFEVDEKEDDTFDIVAVDDRFEPDENALNSFHGICNIITVAIQMWIEGHSTGRFKEREEASGGLFGSPNWHN